MAQRRRTTAKGHTTTKRRPASRKKPVDRTLNWVGVALTIIGLLALTRVGALGIVMANCYRLVIGDTVLFASALTAAFGLWLLFTGRLVKIPVKQGIGGGLIYLGALILWTATAMAKLAVHSHYWLATWRLLKADFAVMSATTDVGGGLLGAAGFSLFAPLLSATGAVIVAWLLILIGGALAVGLTADQFFAGCHWVGAKLGRAGQSLAGGAHALTQKAAAAQAERKAQPPRTKPASKGATDGDGVQQPKPVFADDKDLPTPLADSDEFTIKGAVPTGTEPTPQPSKQPSPRPATKPEPTPEPDEVTLATGDDAALDDYILPPLDLLTQPAAADQTADYQMIKRNRTKLKQTFESFGVDVTVKSATLGPSITQYEIQPAVGVKVSKIVNLADDLALALAAKDIRIEAPIPGKSLIGIEVPNQQVATVGYRDVLANTPQHPGKPLVIPLGRDVDGNVKTFDLTKMPHLLIAGATGSGKSVMINVIITSILMTAKPTEVRMMLIDPKKVELSVYNGVPHLLTPVVTEAKKAPSALNKVLDEMTRRYELFEAGGVRNVGEYNKKAAAAQDPNLPHLPLIVVVVDELSDLMMVAGSEVETALVRLGQMARAAGIHVIIATQRPSVDVITGLIKANFPSRIAFAVSSGVDSRTILDANGAEKLLGRGDMLFAPMDASKPMRIQGAFIPSEDVEAVVEAITNQVAPAYDDKMAPADVEEGGAANGESEDELYEDAKAFVIQQQGASTSMLQRNFRIGYNRAARLIDDLEKNGVVGPSEGSKPRKVYGQGPVDAGGQN
ncbi:DNA translocase FtsK [Lacticaseibacillus mingshuiensis]|uniref:DNA translocase FtsK n=1 Tax=Lacticaseibacillus mingshuiensis TaxID=2799574 RepID=UPI00194DF7A7|nr:DNA translocase FtsK [Lacticaseibacillus mingshuiensis]